MRSKIKLKKNTSKDPQDHDNDFFGKVNRTGAIR